MLSRPTLPLVPSAQLPCPLTISVNFSLKNRLGAVSVTPEVQERIRRLSIAQLEDLAKVLSDFSQP